ncbi:MAG: hypothetical protein ACE5NM_03900 [Sedimentisphaerales bacterium]
MEFMGDIARKKASSSLLAIEATKTKLAGEIGTDSGLFYVPRVLNFDQDKGLLDFERLSGLVTLLQLAIDKDARLLELSEKAGRSLAVIHDQLILPDEMKHELPPEWMDPPDKNAFIHGDFACINVCLHKPTDQLVILDWSAAPIIGRTPTFGSRYFDILWFVSCAFRGAPGMRFLSWNAEGMADAFLKGYLWQSYARHGSAHNLSRYRNYLPKIYKLHREKVCRLARQRSALKAAAYIGPQVLMYARLRKFLHNFEL